MCSDDPFICVNYIYIGTSANIIPNFKWWFSNRGEFPKRYPKFMFRNSSNLPIFIPHVCSESLGMTRYDFRRWWVEPIWFQAVQKAFFFVGGRPRVDLVRWWFFTFWPQNLRNGDYEKPLSRWWFQTFFVFTPKFGDMMKQFDQHIFQMGWNF